MSGNRKDSSPKKQKQNDSISLFIKKLKNDLILLLPFQVALCGHTSTYLNQVGGQTGQQSL